MSGFPVRTPLDVAKYRQQYQADLDLRAKLDDINLQGNKIYQRTGAAPNIPTDTRTTTEKLADLYKLRIELRSKLGEIMSGDDAQKVVDSLDDGESQFLAQQISTIIADLKPKFRLGVPADVFNNYFNRYLDKFNETQGVEFGLQQATGQQILANQQLLAREMVKPETIAQLRSDIERSGLSAGRREQILDNLKEIQDAVRIIPGVFDAINKTNENSIVQDNLLRGINDLVRELPTNQQLVEQLQQLGIALQTGDQSRTMVTLKKIEELTTYAGDLSEEISALRQQTGQRMTPTATPLKSLNPDVVDTMSKKDLIKWWTETLKKYESSDPVLYENIVAMARDSKLIGPRTVEISQTIRKEDLQQLIVNIVRFVFNSEQQVPTATTAGTPFQTPAKDTNVKIGPSSGLVKMKGKGLAKAVPAGPCVSKVDLSMGMTASPAYVPFGNYLINRKKLEDGIVMIKRHSGQFMSDLKSRRVSPSLTNIFKKISGGQLPSFNDYEKLDDDERAYLQHVAKKSNLHDKLQVPSPKKTKTEELINQYEVMRGQLIAGNDSKDLIRKFKQVILQLSEQDLIPKSQLREILIELAKMDI